MRPLETRDWRSKGIRREGREPDGIVNASAEREFRRQSRGGPFAATLALFDSRGDRTSEPSGGIHDHCSDRHISAAAVGRRL